MHGPHFLVLCWLVFQAGLLPQVVVCFLWVVDRAGPGEEFAKRRRNGRHMSVAGLPWMSGGDLMGVTGLRWKMVVVVLMGKHE